MPRCVLSVWCMRASIDVKGAAREIMHFTLCLLSPSSECAWVIEWARHSVKHTIAHTWHRKTECVCVLCIAPDSQWVVPECDQAVQGRGEFVGHIHPSALTPLLYVCDSASVCVSMWTRLHIWVSVGQTLTPEHPVTTWPGPSWVLLGYLCSPLSVSGTLGGMETGDGR